MSQDNGAEQIRILGGGIPCAAYGLSGTKKLRENVARMTQEYPESRAVLMRNHGALCMGRDEDEAFEVAHTLEQVCEKLYQDKTGIIFQSEKLSARGSYGRSLRRGNRAAFRLGDRKEVYRLGKRPDGRRAPEFRLHEIIYRHTGKNCVLHVRTPYVMAASMEGKTLKGYLDDTVQIVGLTLCCIPDREFTGRQAKRLEAALLGRSAVLLKDNGAICVGKTPDDARAVAGERLSGRPAGGADGGSKTRQPGPRLAGADDLPEKIFKTEIEQAGASGRDEGDIPGEARPSFCEREEEEWFMCWRMMWGPQE